MKGSQQSHETGTKGKVRSRYFLYVLLGLGGLLILALIVVLGYYVHALRSLTITGASLDSVDFRPLGLGLAGTIRIRNDQLLPVFVKGVTYTLMLNGEPVLEGAAPGFSVSPHETTVLPLNATIDYFSTLSSAVGIVSQKELNLSVEGTVDLYLFTRPFSKKLSIIST
ncbi:hypothetical protein COY95_03835 [Candidatus Woesearchaeota archaeon CG_4_10_14_0_8_um_filter_47_5]|nr:MAG: hypothetical protein COY95_03835 [Candidatus Woesearchaeota archaeon CG_4_10_14_0_8_um_filter_47_5]